MPEQFGRYRILKKLRQGGMGAVYLAHDTQLDRKVALKVPHFTADDGPDVLERFHREARAAATVQHPNVCPVHDVGEIDGVRYLTMAYLSGRPLSDFVRGDQPLPQRQAAALVRKLALALEEAHRCGVIHRDLKPANIMINERKEPVIMDFGLARRLDKGDARLTQTGSALGTPAYMPPEQVSGQAEQMGPGSDVYSLGVILYELLTGRLPFEGPMMAVLGQILTQEPPPPTSHRPGLDPQLEAVCRKAMAKRAQDRYPTMADLAAALAAYLRQEGAVPPSKATGKASSSHPAIRQSQSNSLSRQLFNDGASREGPVPPPSAVRKAEHPGRPRVPRWVWVSLAGGAAAVILSIVIIIIKSDGKDSKVQIKDGGKTMEITVSPEASRPAEVTEGPKEVAHPAVPDTQDEPVGSPKGGESVVTKSCWAGTFELQLGGMETPATFDLLIIVKDRTEERVQFEWWYDRQEQAGLVEGTIDRDGRVAGRFVTPLKGHIAPGLFGRRLSFGRVEGKRWSQEWAPLPGEDSARSTSD